MNEVTPQSTAKLAKLRDIGWTLWDPIGLLPPEGEWGDCANRSFADEYDQYLIAAASKLRKGVPREEVVAYLLRVEKDSIGTSENATAYARAVAVVDAILTDEELWSRSDENDRPN